MSKVSSKTLLAMTALLSIVCLALGDKPQPQPASKENVDALLAQHPEIAGHLEAARHKLQLELATKRQQTIQKMNDAYWEMYAMCWGVGEGSLTAHFATNVLPGSAVAGVAASLGADIGLLWWYSDMVNGTFNTIDGDLMHDEDDANNLMHYWVIGKDDQGNDMYTSEPLAGMEEWIAHGLMEWFTFLKSTSSWLITGRATQEFVLTFTQIDIVKGRLPKCYDGVFRKALGRGRLIASELSKQMSAKISTEAVTHVLDFEDVEGAVEWIPFGVGGGIAAGIAVGAMEQAAVGQLDDIFAAHMKAITDQYLVQNDAILEMTDIKQVYKMIQQTEKQVSTNMSQP